MQADLTIIYLSKLLLLRLYVVVVVQIMQMLLAVLEKNR